MKPLTKIIVQLITLLALTFTLAGCDKLFDREEKQASTEPEVEAIPEVNQANLLSAANLYVYTQLSEALTHAQTLDRVIASFLHHPNPVSLEESQQAWIKTYQAYLKASYFHKVPRFEKPQFIEQNQTYQDIHQLLDTWPIEGGYIDYLPGYPLSGIINDMTLKISEASLLDQHGFSDFSYASVGFHPMEFLLFGEDGKRSARDFIPKENSIEVVSVDANDAGNKSAEAGQNGSELEGMPEKESTLHADDTINDLESIQPQNHNRRREYLRILSALMVSNLQKLADRWEPAHGYYAKAWRHPETQVNLDRLFQTSVDHLATDILAQHITPIIVADEIEDFRSPYSNTDIQNILALVEGVQNWWMFENSVNAELKRYEPELASNIEKQFAAVLKRLKKAPKNVLSANLKKRKKALSSLQKDMVKLLEQMYGSAQVLGVRLAPLPLSHE